MPLGVSKGCEFKKRSCGTHEDVAGTWDSIRFSLSQGTVFLEEILKIFPNALPRHKVGQIISGDKNQMPSGVPDAQQMFTLTNTIALVAWVGLVLFPGWRIVSSTLCAVIVPGFLAALYVGIIGWRMSAGLGPRIEMRDMATITGLQNLFKNDWFFVAAWTHYLVFDMVVGAWVARDAVRLKIPWLLRTASLVLTFLSGPVGFLMYVVSRGLLRQTCCIEKGESESLKAIATRLLSR
jgi:hypothetical protein